MNIRIGSILTTIFFVVALSACGGGGGEVDSSVPAGDTTDNPPQVSDVTYSPQRAYPTPAKDSEVVTGSVVVFDPDGDATFVRIIFDAGTELTFPISGGAASATVIEVSVEISLLVTPGPYEFIVEAVDSRNNVSNSIVGTFAVGAWMKGVKGGYVLTADGFELTNISSSPEAPCAPLELGRYEIVPPTALGLCEFASSFDTISPTGRTLRWSRGISTTCIGVPRLPIVDIIGEWGLIDELYGDYRISFDPEYNVFTINNGGGYCEMP